MDEIIPFGLEKTLHIVSILFVGLYLMRILLSALRSHLMLYLSIRLDLPLMMGYYQHVTKLPLNFFSTRHIGEITSRFEDAGAIKEAVSGATLTLMLDTIMVVVGGLILYFINPTMFLFAVVIVILYAILVYAFIKPFKRIKRESMEQGARVSTYLIESIQGVETLKAFNSEDAASLETEKRYVKATLIGKKGGILSNIQGSLIGVVESLGGLAILWFGALMVIKGNITLGQLLTFSALLGYFMGPIKNLIGLQQGLQQAMVASDRLSEIIDLEIEQGIDEHKKDDLKEIKGNIELKNVKFRYGTRRPVLNDVSLSINKGEKVAIVGESGSGKTTLAKLLLNFYDIEFGEITLDDKNLNSINRAALRENIGYVSQEVFLFSGSVESNLKMSNDITNDEMIRVCKELRVHEFVNLMPKKYMSALIENGANLSGGQRQRLAIVRALLKKPNILILDEATSNLDAKTEETIVNVLNNEYKELTSIIIAHRLSTIRSCDKVIVLDQGDIKEVGTHKELYEKKGIYYNLWKSQIEG